MFHAIGRLYYQAFSGLPIRVWFSAIILLINRSGTMVVPFLTIYLTTKQGYSAAAASFIMVAFGLGGVVGNYVGGLLNDRYGSWHIQVWSLFTSGLIFILLGQVEDYYLFCTIIFLLSVAADAFRPANRAAIATYAPPEKLTQAFGLLRLAVNLGFALGPLLGGLIITYYKYEFLFWADGITCLLAGIVFLLILPKDETARPAVMQDAAPQILDAPLHKSPPPSSPGHHQLWLVTLCTANLLVAMCFFQLFSTAPIYMAEAGYSEFQFGLILTLSGLLIVAFEMPLLYLAKQRYRPLQVLLIGSGLIALSYFFFPLTIGLGMGAICAFIIVLTIGEMLYMPFGNTYVTQKAPLARRGEYLGLLSASYSLAFVLSPLVGLNVAEQTDFATANYLLAALGACGVMLLIWLYKVGEHVSFRRRKFV